MGVTPYIHHQLVHRAGSPAQHGEGVVMILTFEMIRTGTMLQHVVRFGRKTGYSELLLGIQIDLVVLRLRVRIRDSSNGKSSPDALDVNNRLSTSIKNKVKSS